MNLNATRLPKTSLEFIEPMFAKTTHRLPAQPGWLYELKYDGYRTMVMKDRGVITLFSRRGKRLNTSFKSISLAFDFLPEGTIIDGEIVALDARGKPIFSSLQHSRLKPESLYFYAFDLIAYVGKDVRKLTFFERRVLLEDHVLRGMRDPVRLSVVFSVAPSQLVAAAKTSGLGGVIAKRADGTYESGECSGAWLKYRTNKGHELVIGGYKPGRVGFDYLLGGYYEGKEVTFIGRIKTGFTPALRRAVARKFKPLETKKCPFANLPEPQNARRGDALTAKVMTKMKWLRPRLVAQVEFTEGTSRNQLRYSKFVSLRDGKSQ